MASAVPLATVVGSREDWRMRQVGRAGLVPLLLFAVMLGCGRTPGVDTSSNLASNGPLPFDRSGSDSGISPTGTILPVTVPAGTPITVRLQSAVSSESAQSGDSFAAVLDEPVIIDSQTVVPRGAAITGKVVSAKASGHLHQPGYLRLTLASVSLNGKSLPLQTSTVFVKGSSHQKRNLAFIGGGTGGGALIGGLAGGGKGALIGGLVGAAGGTGAAYATGEKNVGFAAERKLTFRLIQPLPLQG